MKKKQKKTQRPTFYMYYCKNTPDSFKSCNKLPPNLHIAHSQQDFRKSDPLSVAQISEFNQSAFKQSVWFLLERSTATALSIFDSVNKFI